MKSSSPPLRCPKCGNDQIIAHGKRYALYPLGCLVILTLPLSWMHRSAAPYDFECLSCGKRFAKRTVPAKIAFGFLWLMLGVLVAALLMKALRAA